MLGLIALGLKLERIFNFYNDVDRDRATKNWPSKNVLCFTNSNEGTIVLSVRP